MAEHKLLERHANANWYVIHTYSGYENKVKANLEKRVQSMGMEDKIFQVLVPVEEEVEIKDGKKRTVQKKIFPGYVLVEMVMTDDSWYVVRNTPGVTGFVGSGSKPTALDEEEVRQILRQMGLLEEEAPKPKPKPRIDLELGQNIRVRSGPFDGFIGVIDGIDVERGKVRVLVSMFGRETPVELDFTQVEKL
ncbi:MAG: transcription termination/antitermination protein NusG [Clostridia bacterium]|nr:transcription termination/antitermination protein NusG [Clostridia bacterium]